MMMGTAGNKKKPGGGSYEDVPSVEDKDELQLGSSGNDGGDDEQQLQHGTPSRGKTRMSPTQRRQQVRQVYASVPTNEGSDGSEEQEDDEPFDDEYDNRNRTRRRRNNFFTMNNNQQNSTRGFFFILYLSVLGFLALIAVGLLLYGRELRHHAQQQQQQQQPGDNDNNKQPPVAPAASTTTASSSSSSSTTATTTTNPAHTVHYDPTWTVNDPNRDGFVDPYDNNAMGALLVPPSPVVGGAATTSDDSGGGLGYIRHPHIVNNSMVFIVEGDLYYARLNNADSDKGGTTKSSLLPAMKLTTTVGNVLSPRLDPSGHKYVAYTATYTAHRDLYVMDLSGNAGTVTRLTYGLDSPHGVTSVAGWKDSDTIVVGAYSNRVSLPDSRLYEIHLKKTSSALAGGSGIGVLQTKPVPLAQAVDGVYDTASESNSHCLYFVRVKQSSQTVRYIGGTVENIWAYCDGQSYAVPLLTQHNMYNGTSKSPAIAKYNNQDYLLFLSDRGRTKSKSDDESSEKDEWTPMTMNLWAMPLPTHLYAENNAEQQQQQQQKMIQLTSISCQFNGQALQEYSVDVVTGDVVLRIGADLYRLPASGIAHKLKDNSDEKKKFLKPNLLPIRVYSDFHEHQERLIKIKPTEHLKNADIFDTAFGQTQVLATLRGQTWVLPVVDKTPDDISYKGIGQNLPPRRYRVAPAATTGGSMRVLAARYVPILNKDDDDGKDKGADADDDASNTKNTTQTNPATRLAVILATDPQSPTAEHAFYLVEVHSAATNAFTAAFAATKKQEQQQQLKPFLGGGAAVAGGGGGSTEDGGLGSVLANSLTVSPCGRRMAWADTDGRILVVTLPVYATKTNSSKPATTKPPTVSYKVLPEKNEMGEPIDGSLSDISWSPGGRYLAVKHGAKNQFDIISIVDCGDPLRDKIRFGRGVVQATPSRFNVHSMYWGKASLDYYLHTKLAKIAPDRDEPAATTLYFLTDRDVKSDVNSPWGSRAPLPHFVREMMVYALPLQPKKKQQEEEDDTDYSKTTSLFGRFAGGGAMEVFVDDLLAIKKAAAAGDKTATSSENATSSDTNATTDTVSDRRRIREQVVRDVTRNLRSKRLTSNQVISIQRFLDGAETPPAPEPQPDGVPPASDPSSANITAPSTGALGEDSIDSDDEEEEEALLLDDSDLPSDMEIDFGPVKDLSFARKAYPLSRIPKGNYVSILSQTIDDGSLVIIEKADTGQGYTFKVFSIDDFPSDSVDVTPISLPGHVLGDVGLSTSRKYMYNVYLPDGKIRVVPNTATSLAKFVLDAKGDANANYADTSNLAISVYPALEYKQMYNDAWRLLRDYFYDSNMHGLEWPELHERYLPLVQRCAKREDLDDVLSQLAAELSALHVFVYGGEYNSPFGGDDAVSALHEPASLGVSLERAPEWKGYRVTEIPEPDPDYAVVNDKTVYCPLSDYTLSLSGQKGLQVGDIIVGINGESVMQSPDIFYQLRGMAGHSLRLEVLRLASGSSSGGGDDKKEQEAKTEPIVTTAISPVQAQNLRYSAWEWHTRQKAKELAAEAGFSVGYVHLRAMDREAEQAFARDYFPDYDKQALILDVRHNGGGNIDSWILSFLQRKAWMYWKTRTRYRGGDMDWDEQFSFNGHIVVLIDEHTGSDGEGVSRGMAELGLGRLIGTRTWGGGIWLSSDNGLVDGGIATAPEVGTFNDHFAFGLGYENYGVDPDVEVDNDPRSTFDGTDTQLERAIDELKQWMQDVPVIIPNPPDFVKDVSINEDCSAV